MSISDNLACDTGKCEEILIPVIVVAVEPLPVISATLHKNKLLESIFTSLEVL
jgi:hypothetical protein